jgi:hypothetical protein
MGYFCKIVENLLGVVLSLEFAHDLMILLAVFIDGTRLASYDCYMGSRNLKHNCVSSFWQDLQSCGHH